MITNFEKYTKERISKTINLIPNNVKSILDLGCGKGTITDIIKEKYFTVSADISMNTLSKMSAIKVLCRGEKLPFNNEEFDLILCTEVLEHIDDKYYFDFLSEMQRVSKRYIVISVPNMEQLYKGNTKCFKCGRIYHISQHVREYNIDRIRYLFNKFYLDKIEKAGKRKRIQLKALYDACHYIGNSWANSNNNICPYCNNDNSQGAQQNIFGWILKRLIWQIEKILSTKERNSHPAWLIAIYKRRKVNNLF